MFRCQVCQSTVPAQTPGQKLIVKRRKKEYKYRSLANSFFRRTIDNKRKLRHADDPGGEGYEIALELIVCPACAIKKN